MTAQAKKLVPVAASETPVRFPVRPPAGRARLRLRHLLAMCSFLLTVAAPVWIAGIYLYESAHDQYASRAGFTVRKEEVNPAISNARSQSARDCWACTPFCRL